jgi:hypothetical protein
MNHSRSAVSYILILTILIASSVATFLYFSTTQGPLTHRGGMGWDGEHYYKIAEQFIAGDDIVGEGPLVYRIGTPAVVALVVGFGIVDDIKDSFFLVNSAFSYANIFLVFFILTRFLNPWVALVGAILFPLHWASVARYTFFTPLWTDPAGLFFVYLGIAVITAIPNRRGLLSVLLSMITFAGIFFREFVMLVPVLFLLTQFPPTRILSAVRSGPWGELLKVAPIVLMPLVAGLFASVLIQFVSEAVNSHRLWKTALFMLWINSPQYFLYTIFTTVGIAAIFPVLQGRFLLDYLKGRPLIFIALSILLLATFLGGDNNEKYLAWAFPFLYIVIVQTMRKEAVPPWAFPLVLVFYLIFVCRLAWPIPDYDNVVVSPPPLFTYLSAEFRLLDLFVIHSEKLSSGKIFFQYLLTCAGLIGLMRYRRIFTWLKRAMA